MDFPAAQYDFYFEAVAVPALVSVWTQPKDDGIAKDGIFKIEIKNCNGSKLVIPSNKLTEIKGQFLGSLGIQYFTTENCRLSNLKLMVRMIKDRESAKPYYVSYMVKIMKDDVLVTEMTKDQVPIEWVKK